MKEAIVAVLLVAVPILILITAVGTIGIISTAINDEYCKTIPIERMDKERCGVK